MFNIYIPFQHLLINNINDNDTKSVKHIQKNKAYDSYNIHGFTTLIIVQHQ